MIWIPAPADPPDTGSSSCAILSPRIRDNPARVLLNNQATDRLTDLFEADMAVWPWFLKVNHDADDADRVPEGAQRIWSRAHGATGPVPERPSSNISDSYYLWGTSAAVVIAACRAVKE